MSHSEKLDKNITFYVEPFYYTISYREDPLTFDTTLYIELVHNVSFLTWSGSLDHKLLNNDTKTTTKLLDLTPSIVFSMFSDYVNNMLDPSVQFKFPSKYKSPTDSIYIEIILIAIVFGGNKVEDPRMIILNSKEVNFEDRNDKKIEQIHVTIDNKIKNINNEIVNKIDDLQTNLTRKLLESSCNFDSSLETKLESYRERLELLETRVTHNYDEIVNKYNLLESRVTFNYDEIVNKYNLLETKYNELLTNLSTPQNQPV